MLISFLPSFITHMNIYTQTKSSFFSMSDIMKSRLFKYIENFTTKNWKFSDKNSDIFHISA